MKNKVVISELLGFFHNIADYLLFTTKNAKKTIKIAATTQIYKNI